MSTGISNDVLIGRSRRRLLVGGVLAAACLASSLPVRAAEPRDAIVRSDGTLPAETLVQEALTAEMEGRSGDRDRWAHEALKDSPEHPAAHWLDGQVLVNQQWVRIEETPYVFVRDHKYQEYLRRRSKCADTAWSQFQLGDWCKRRGLTEQARAHFTRAIEIYPDHAMVRSRLGYVRVRNERRTSAEIKETKHPRTNVSSDYTQWRFKITMILQDVSAADPEQAQKAREELLAIDTPAAIPALEWLAAPGGPTGILATEAIGRIRGPEASLALARLALRFAVPADVGEARRKRTQVATPGGIRPQYARVDGRCVTAARSTDRRSRAKRRIVNPPEIG